MAKVVDHNPESSESAETRAFEAEVGKVLNLVVNSLSKLNIYFFHPFFDYLSQILYLMRDR